jgi:hypothetical protein
MRFKVKATVEKAAAKEVTSSKDGQKYVFNEHVAVFHRDTDDMRPDSRVGFQMRNQLLEPGEYILTVELFASKRFGQIACAVVAAEKVGA